MFLSRKAILGGIAFSVLANGHLVAQNRDEGEAACLKRLRLVQEAIEAWRRVRGDFPPNLGCLVENGFLQGNGMLICPEAERRLFLKSVPDGVLTSTLADDSASYEYELEQTTRPNEMDAAGLDKPKRRAWKKALLQGPLAEVVPILRCLFHKSGALNVPITGKAYRSELNWEYQFVDLLPEVYAMPWMAINRGPSIHDHAKPRRLDLPSSSLDLSKVANALTADPWLDGFADGDSLAALAQAAEEGDLNTPSASFDCRYLLQVCGRYGTGDHWRHRRSFGGPSYPRLSKTLQINCAQGTKISVLHATAYPAPLASKVGYLKLKVGNHEQQVPLVYGENTSVWRHTPKEKPAGPVPAWSGKAGISGWDARIFLLSFTVELPAAIEVPAEICLEANPESPAGPFVIGIKLDN